MVLYRVERFVMQVYGTKVLLPRVKVTVADFSYPSMPFSFIAPKICSINWFSNLSILSVPYEGYSRNALCALNLISTFLFLFKHIHHNIFIGFS
jgi:hypothetical protein